LPAERGIIDATSGGALMDKTPLTARNLISNMIVNTQQFHSTNSSRAMHETQTTFLDTERINNR